MEGIRFDDISRRRSEVMGLAMLFVVLFHVSLPRQCWLYPLQRCGNVGVDIFLFVSGVGLWFTWTRAAADGRPLVTRVRQFFARRYRRVYPAWLIAACLYYIPDYLSATPRYTPDVPNLVANILVGWSFWRVDDLTFWFVPAIMMLYTIAPVYMWLIRRWPSCRWLPVMFMVWAVMVYYYPPVRHAVGHVEIFWSRIPIFLLGINSGRWVKEHRTADVASLWVTAAALVLSLAMSMKFEEMWRGRFPLFIERMVYIPLAVALVLLLSRLLTIAPRRMCRALAFVGTYSLEIYLIHYEFVLRHVRLYVAGYWPTVLLTLAVTLPVAWVVGRLTKLSIKTK